MSNVIEIKRKTPLKAMLFTGENIKEILEFVGGGYVETKTAIENGELKAISKLKVPVFATEKDEFIELIKGDYVCIDETGKYRSLAKETLAEKYEILI